MKPAKLISLVSIAICVLPQTRRAQAAAAERMPLAAGEAPAEHPIIREGTMSVDCTESPLFLWRDAAPAT